MNKAVIIMGSKKDRPHADQIGEHLSKISSGIEIVKFARSGHKWSEGVKEVLKDFDSSDNRIVYITIAGRSDALSGVVGAGTLNPSIASRPDWNKDSLKIDIFSTLRPPSDVPYGCVLGPEATAEYVRKILSMKDEIKFKGLCGDEYDPKTKEGIENKLIKEFYEHLTLLTSPEDDIETITEEDKEKIYFYIGSPNDEKLDDLIEKEGPVILAYPISNDGNARRYITHSKEKTIALVENSENAALFGLKIKSIYNDNTKLLLKNYFDGVREKLIHDDASLRI